MGSKTDTSRKLMLIDAYALFNRAFYALPSLSTSSGQPTGAVYGVASMLLRLFDEERPDYVAVAFDRSGPTHRHEAYPEYKGHRKSMPDDLRAQMPVLRELIEAMGLRIFDMAGYEADDIVGTLAKKGEGDGLQVAIVTGDRDLLQLVSQNVQAIITRKGISETDRYDVNEVIEKLGVPPERVTDLKGLQGDTSDNIPGVPGIGPKTAVKLLDSYDTVENLLKHRDEVKGKIGKALAEHADAALLSKQLATIETNLPLEIDWEAVKFETPVTPSLLELFRQLEFSRLIDELHKRFPEATSEAQASQSDDALSTEIFVAAPESMANLATAWAQADGPVLMLVSQDDSAIFVVHRSSNEAGPVAHVNLIPSDIAMKAAETLEAAFSQDGVQWVAYDAKGVMLCLHRYGLAAPAFSDDLMLAGYLLSPGQATHTPTELILRHLQESIEWAAVEAEEGEDPWHLVARSAAPVCEALLRTYDVMMRRIDEEALERVYRDVELPLVPVLTQMEITGVALDTDYLGVLAGEMEAELEHLTLRIHELAGHAFNINSPKQLATVLFEELGLPVKKKTKSGPSTDAAVLEELADEHPIVEAILSFRQAAKLKSTYVDALPALVDPKTGRVHTSFNQAVAATGRLSSVHPNLQNIPIRTDAGRQIRKAFIPGHDDFVLVSLDYSQIELRVLAHISQDDALISAFVDGRDIHTKTASEIFGVAMEEVTPSQRSAAKAINFGIVYGISSFGLARNTGLTRADAQKYIDAYFERYAKVKVYMHDVVAKAREVGYAQTLLGRKRWIPAITSRNWAQRSFAERAAMNTPIQGSAADIMKLAMIRTHELLQTGQHRATILLQVHDELLLEVHREDVADVARYVREAMEGAMTLTVPLSVDCAVGPNWLEMEDVELHA